jgi:hypothetical protein
VNVGLTAGARSLAGRAAGAVALLVALAVLLPVLLLAGLDGQQAVSPGAGAAPDGVPAVYVPLYQAAGGAFGVSWLLLAAIHAQETDFSRSTMPGVRDGANGCGAAGPMQFGIVGIAPYHATAPACGALTGSGAGGTWARYSHAIRRLPAAVRAGSYPLDRSQLAGCAAVPAEVGCVYADADAVAAAAMYLHELGARSELDSRAWEAARRYNGTAAYADAVLARARAWEAQAADDLGALDAPTITGARARLGTDGLARPPADAPSAVEGAVAAANAISDRPYALVHFPTHIANPTYDCSSAVSHVLWGAHQLGTAPWTSGELMTYGKQGPGRWITIYANPAHTFILVAGLRFDTARYDSGPNQADAGPRWRLGARPTDGFVVRHPGGL